MNDQTERSLLNLANDLRSGALSLEEYLQYLERRFDEREPTINSFIEEEGRFDRLKREAKALEKKYPSPMSRPPLFGIPIGVKDIFHVDGFETRAGSNLPIEELRGRQATSISLLKQAGALIMGKTVTTEFAYFQPGPTRNPHHLEHTPGGSSSGSAASVAAGFCPIATGTQTVGSIIRPASFCGIVGFKPSYDRISREGVIPLAPSLDHVGVFARDVASVELAASQLCPDWQIALADNSPVLGVPEGPYLRYATDEGLAHFWATCQILEEAGCEIKTIEVMEDFEEIVARHNLIVAAEAAQVHARWYAEFSDRYQAKIAELIQTGRGISIGELAEALTGRQRLRQQLVMLMDEHGLDLWISPAAPGSAPKGLDSTGDPNMNLPWTHSGLPTVNLPSGKNINGLPLGLQVIGRWYSDEKLLELSAHLEPVVRTVS